MKSRRSAYHRLPLLCLLIAAFAGIRAYGAGTTYTVTNTADSGAGSLRQAILDANDDPGSTIVFDIPGGGPYLISPMSGLPAITADGALIDGTT